MAVWFHGYVGEAEVMNVVKMETPLARAIEIGDAYFDQLTDLRCAIRKALKAMKRNEMTSAKRILKEALGE